MPWTGQLIRTNGVPIGDKNESLLMLSVAPAAMLPVPPVAMLWAIVPPLRLIVPRTLFSDRISSFPPVAMFTVALEWMGEMAVVPGSVNCSVPVAWRFTVTPPTTSSVLSVFTVKPPPMFAVSPERGGPPAGVHVLPALNRPEAWAV